MSLHKCYISFLKKSLSSTFKFTNDSNVKSGC